MRTEETVKKELHELLYLVCAMVALTTNTQPDKTPITQIPTRSVIEMEKKLKFICPEILSACIRDHEQVLGEIKNKKSKGFFKKLFFN